MGIPSVCVCARALVVVVFFCVGFCRNFSSSSTRLVCVVCSWVHFAFRWLRFVDLCFGRFRYRFCCDGREWDGGEYGFVDRAVVLSGRCDAGLPAGAPLLLITVLSSSSCCCCCCGGLTSQNALRRCVSLLTL